MLIQNLDEYLIKIYEFIEFNYDSVYKCLSYYVN
jgi:hypothetical protein